MKFNFKKISAVTASLIMVGMTAGFAAAAAYPAPFVSSSGVADVAVIYGTGVGATDMIPAKDVQKNLATYSTSSSGGTTSSLTGDFFQIHKSNNEFNLGDEITDFYTTIDSDQLSEVLADGVYKNDKNDDFDYEQKVTLGDGLKLTYFANKNFNDEKPVIGFELDQGNNILNYTLDFKSSGATSSEDDWGSFEETTIKILGKEYYILSASNESEKLTLLDSAESGVLTSGESITLGGKTISVVFPGDDKVKLSVDGKATSSLGEGDVEKLDENTYLSVKKILQTSKDNVANAYEVSLGSGKIELIDGKEVKVNGEDMSDVEAYEGNILKAYFTGQESNKLDTITLQWNLDSGKKGRTFLAFDTDSKEITMPLFSNLKLSLGNFIKNSEEVTSVEPDGKESLLVDTEVTDGSVSFNILYTNGTSDFVGAGASDDEKLLTGSGTNPTLVWDDDEHIYFPATWYSGDDYESYLFEVSEIDETEGVTIRSVASGSNEEVTIEEGDSDSIGEIEFTVNSINETAGTVNITLNPSGSNSSDVYADKIITKDGLMMMLPTSVSGNNWTMNFTEEDENGNIGQEGANFSITLEVDSDDETTVSDFDGTIARLETSDGSDVFEGYVGSALATKISHNTGGDQDSVEITYHGTEVYGEVFLSESGSGTDSGDSGVVKGVMIGKDTQVSNFGGKNLIIVGGSCVNSAAADLVGGPFCGNDWTDATNVNPGEWIIKGYPTNPLTTKLALLVAGYEAEDTVNAVTYLTTQKPDTSKETIGPKSLVTS